MLSSNSLAELQNENVKREELILNPEGWFLVSIDSGQAFCEGSFCLCLCSDDSCSQKQICKASDSFILLRDEDGKEKRIIEQETPFGAELSYKKGKIYVFNNAINLLKSTSLFYRFNQAYSPKGRWEWSPDLENWMGLESNVVVGGLWNGEEPVEENSFFIGDFDTFLSSSDQNQNVNYEDKGKEFLKNKDIEESNGVIVFKVVKNE